MWQASSITDCESQRACVLTGLNHRVSKSNEKHRHSGRNNYATYGKIFLLTSTTDNVNIAKYRDEREMPSMALNGEQRLLYSTI